VRLPFVSLCGAMLGFQGSGGQWGKEHLFFWRSGSFYRQRERKALGCVVSMALSLPGLEGAPRRPPGRGALMSVQSRHWLDYDPVALVVLVVGMSAVALLALSI
jgi:hypothetical protein